MLLLHQGCDLQSGKDHLVAGGTEAEPHGARRYAFAKVEHTNHRYPLPNKRQSQHGVVTFRTIRATACEVRNISFTGAKPLSTTRCCVERMRQLEGGWLSNTSLERSKKALQRCRYVKERGISRNTVARTPDLV